MYVIQVFGTVTGEAFQGRNYVVDFKPDFADHDGGFVNITTDPMRARTFRDPEETIPFVMQRSTRVPVRPDGLPNRPFLNFVIAVIPYLDALEEVYGRVH